MRASVVTPTCFLTSLKKLLQGEDQIASACTISRPPLYQVICTTSRCRHQRQKVAIYAIHTCNDVFVQVMRTGYTTSEQAHCLECVEFRCIVTSGNYVEQRSAGLWDGLEL
jgi:hypothetical protein